MYEWNEHQAGRGDFPLALPKELIAKTEEVQADFTEDDPRIGQIQDYLDKLRADGITRVCSKQVAVEALGLGDDDCRNNKALFGDISTIIDYRCPGWKRHGSGAPVTVVWRSSENFRRRCADTGTPSCTP